MAAKTCVAAISLSLLGYFLPAPCLGQVPPTLTISEDAAGNVSGSVSAVIHACGITAAGGAEPTFSIKGTTITVTQPLIAALCVNPPPPDRAYRQTVVFGKLPAATYTVNWNFPELSATYAVRDIAQVTASDPAAAPTLGVPSLLGMAIGIALVGARVTSRRTSR